MIGTRLYLDVSITINKMIQFYCDYIHMMGGVAKPISRPSFFQWIL